MSLSVKKCFRQNGITAVGDIPCDPNAQDSTCCGPNSVCVQNFYCRDPSGSPVSGSCTDQTWGVRAVANPACPCRPFYKTDNSTLNYADSVTFCSDGSVCCGIGNDDCCKQGKGNPVIFYGNTAAIPSGTAGLSSYYVGVKASTSPITRASSTSSSTNGSSSATSSAGISSSTGSANGGSSSGTKIGIGIGIGVGGSLIALSLVIGALYILVWAPRKRYSKLDKSQSGKQEWMDPDRHEAPIDGQLVELDSVKSTSAQPGSYAKSGRYR